MLLQELNDMRTNLKINKEIIYGFYSILDEKEKNKYYHEKLIEDNKHLSFLNEKTSKEKEDLRQQVFN